MIDIYNKIYLALEFDVKGHRAPTNTRLLNQDIGVVLKIRLMQVDGKWSGQGQQRKTHLLPK